MNSRQLLAIAILISATSIQAAELRTWTDISGKFSVKGKLVSDANGKVILLNEAGKKLAIPLEQLSEADRKYLANLKTPVPENPFKPVEEESPFQPVATPSVIEVDLSTVREVLAVPTLKEWKFEPPAVKSEERVTYKPVPTPPKRDFWEKGQGFETSVASGKVIFGYAYTNKKTKQVLSRYQLSDMIKGESQKYEITDLEQPMYCIALSDTGTTAIMRRNEFGFGKSDFLERWSFGEKAIEREVRWTPYAKSRGGNRDVKMVRFLPNDRLMTVSGGGTVVVWDAKTIKPIYKFAIKGGSYPGLSPDRKLLCYSRGNDIGVLDLEKGEVLAAQRVGNLTWPHLRFNPTATKVACLDHNRLKVYDFASGEMVLDRSRRGFPSGSYRFVSEDHLLLNNSALFDIKNQLIVWSFADGWGEDFGENMCFLTKGSSSPGLLVVDRLPLKAMTEALDNAMQDEDFWVLNKGTTVRLDLDGLPDSDGKESVKAALTKKLSEYGINVGDKGTIDLVASIEAKKEKKKVSYSVGFGPIPPSPFGRGGLKYEVKEFVSHLKFVYEGKTAWESQMSSVPRSFRLKDGDTIEKLLRRSEKPNYGWYEKIELPDLLRKPTGSPTLGTTKITSAGLR